LKQPESTRANYPSETAQSKPTKRNQANHSTNLAKTNIAQTKTPTNKQPQTSNQANQNKNRKAGTREQPKNTQEQTSQKTIARNKHKPPSQPETNWAQTAKTWRNRYNQMPNGQTRKLSPRGAHAQPKNPIEDPKTKDNNNQGEQAETPPNQFSKL
jgi:hypothetical protein